MEIDSLKNKTQEKREINRTITLLLNTKFETGIRTHISRTLLTCLLIWYNACEGNSYEYYEKQTFKSFRNKKWGMKRSKPHALPLHNVMLSYMNTKY